VVAASRQGVSTFLAPAQDAPAARRADHGDMKIVTIHTFNQALHYLQSHD
jgi:PDZ domain-containing secreted protein